MRTSPYPFEEGWVPIGQTRGEPVHIDVMSGQGPFDDPVGLVQFSNGVLYLFHPSDHAKVIRWFKWWFDDMVEH